MSYRNFTIFFSLLLLLGVILWQSGVVPKLAADLGITQGESKRAEVVRVIDGDTVEVAVAGKKQVVRMIGIDTPETVRPGVAKECGGQEASDYMKKLLPPGTEVRVVTDPTQDSQDTYGRTLAYIYPLRSQESYGEQIIAAGWAEAYVYSGRPGQESGEYDLAQEEARQQNLGVWKKCNGDFHSEQ